MEGFMNTENGLLRYTGWGSSTRFGGIDGAIPSSWREETKEIVFNEIITNYPEGTLNYFLVLKPIHPTNAERMVELNTKLKIWLIREIEKVRTPKESSMRFVCFVEKNRNSDGFHSQLLFSLPCQEQYISNESCDSYDRYESHRIWEGSIKKKVENALSHLRTRDKTKKFNAYNWDVQPITDQTKLIHYNLKDLEYFGWNSLDRENSDL
jgi:hypothetical protein